MKSLFFRIFLWFWLTISVIGMSTVLLTLSEETGPFLTLWRGQVANAMALFGEAGLQVWAREGRGGLRAYLERLNNFDNAKAFLFDRYGNELSGRPVSEKVRHFAEQALADDEPSYEYFDDIFVAGLKISDARGTPFVVVREMPRRLFWYLLENRLSLSDVGIRLLLMITVVGLLSYTLARYLVRPILGLEAAVRRFAGGDLEVRVDPAVRGRRDEIGQLGRDFDHMAERIESLMRAQRRLLRDISHELRSPLARMAVALELARARAGSGAQSNLDRIEREAERLNELIGQLLTLVRMESSSVAVETKSVDLSALVQRLVQDEDFEARARSRGVTAKIAEGLAIEGNEELLRRALENVLRNAVRYTAEGSPVKVELIQNLVDTRWWAELSIRDHGPGVPPAALDEMFLAFRRIGDARERDNGGVGLGLAIADHAVRAHHGKIWAENMPSGGMRVVIRLPMAEPGQL
jgi:signal transduction histidine kinase